MTASVPIVKAASGDAVGQGLVCARLLETALNPESGDPYEVGLRAWLAALIRARGAA